MMEGSVPSVSMSNSHDVDRMEARFTELFQGLALGEIIQKEAVAVLRESKDSIMMSLASSGSQQQDEMERHWFAFVLFCVARLGKEKTKDEKEEAGKITLCHIQRAAKLNIIDFFKEMPQFSVKASNIFSNMYGSDWEKKLELKELEENALQLTDLSKFYSNAYKRFFLLDDSKTCQNPEAYRCTEHVSDFQRFGWLLFVTLRNTSFGHCKNMVTCTNSLVSILVILILHIPGCFRKFSIQDSCLFAKRSDKGVNLLASFCELYGTSEDDLKRTLDKSNQLIVDILKKKPCQASECNTEILDHIDKESLTYFEDLLEEKSLKASLTMLQKNYDDTLSAKSELDECLFIYSGYSSVDAQRSPRTSTGYCAADGKFDEQISLARMMSNSSPYLPRSFQNGNHEGLSNIAPNTPVRTAMTTAKWLRDVISPLPSKPSMELECFLSSCEQNLTSGVTHRADIILEAIFPSSSFGERCVSVSLQSANMNEDIAWAHNRKMEALKLYYRVLEAVCVAESQLLGSNNLTHFLANERFHRCMLACSAELVLATHKTVILMFPAVLERTGLTAFDLSKVIEIFIRHEETLPRELKRHLNSLEERLLESMAWEKGSSLYNSMILAMPNYSAEITSLGLLAEPMPSLESIVVHHDIPIESFLPLTSQRNEASQGNDGDIRPAKRLCTENRTSFSHYNSFTSPVKQRLLTFNCLKSRSPTIQSAFASPSKPNPAGGESCAETAIKVFFNKILKLAAIRIRSLCGKLELSPQVTEQLYCLFQKILQRKTALFFNRHIDQVILCSLYGASKVFGLGITFKNILSNYKKQPQCKPQVFKSVFVGVPSANGNGRMVQEHVDIIKFYNRIFVPSVKPLLVDLVPDGGLPSEDKIIGNGKLPSSPKISPLPKLPDMSPKKVSAAHNIYVSPLRSTKIDALLSPSSGSYYACIGESTRAYQSPSSDLAAINNRINSGNATRQRLDFDVVSDAVVANLLGHSNGNSISSIAAEMLKVPPKQEQSDI